MRHMAHTRHAAETFVASYTTYTWPHIRHMADIRHAAGTFEAESAYEDGNSEAEQWATLKAALEEVPHMSLQYYPL